MRSTVKVVAAFLIWPAIILGTGLVYAQGCREEGEFVIASDLAPIINGDREQAKNLAVFGAQRRALECRGLHLRAETLLSRGLQITDSIWIEVEGFIKAWELVEAESGVVGDGYRATVKSWVKSGGDLSKEKRNLFSLHKVLFIADNDAEKAVEKVLTAELRKTIGDVRIHDADFVKNNVKKIVWKQLCDRNLYALDQSAFQFEADLIIHIKSAVEPVGPLPIGDTSYDKYSGNATVRLFQLSGERRGEAIVEKTSDFDRMFIKRYGDPSIQRKELLSGKNPNYFLRNVAEPVSTVFMEELMNCQLFAVPDRVITVVIHDIPSEGEYKKFLTTVKNQRGVGDRVRETSHSGSTYTLSVQFPMKSIYLANLIAQEKTYRKVGHGWNRIEFQYNTQ